MHCPRACQHKVRRTLTARLQKFCNWTPCSITLRAFSGSLSVWQLCCCSFQCKCFPGSTKTAVCCVGDSSGCLQRAQLDRACTHTHDEHYVNELRRERVARLRTSPAASSCKRASRSSLARCSATPGALIFGEYIDVTQNLSSRKRGPRHSVASVAAAVSSGSWWNALTLTVNNQQKGATIPQDFTGLSCESPSLATQSFCRRTLR